MDKFLTKLKLKSKTDTEYIGKLTKHFLKVSNSNSEKIISAVDNLITISKKIDDPTKNKKIVEELDKIKKAIHDKENKVEITNSLNIKEPEWIEEIKPVKNEKIENVLKEIKKEVSKIEIPEVNIPERIEIKKPNWWNIKEVTGYITTSIKKYFEDSKKHITQELNKTFKIKSENPLTVILTDRRGRYIDITKLGGIITGGSNTVFNIKNTDDEIVSPATETKQDEMIAEMQKLAGFEIPAYDEINLTYVASGNGAGEIETVTYKAGGDTVATLILSYDADNNISSIIKT